MQTDQNIGELPPSPIEPDKNQNLEIQLPRTPAKVPAHSSAAVAQRLNDIPERHVASQYCPVSQHLIHESGWRAKRHLKRKFFRQTMNRLASVDRISLKTLVPVSITLFSIFMVILIVFVTIASFATATNQKFGSKITTLADVLPQDNTKLYDMHGKLIYQSLSQGMQTSIPLNDVSKQLIHAEIAIEDQNFFSNPGYDITGIVRAAISNLSSKK